MSNQFKHQVFDDDDDDDDWGDDGPELEDNNTRNVQPSRESGDPSTVNKFDEMKPEEDQQFTFEENLVGGQQKKDRKKDAMRSGIDFNDKGQLKNFLKQDEPKNDN